MAKRINLLSTCLYLWLIFHNYDVLAQQYLQPYIYSQIIHSTNQFRLANDQEALAVIGSTEMAETVTQLGGGLRAQVPISLQTLKADALIYKAAYDKFPSLDHTAIDAQATWDWQVGRFLNGDIGGNYTDRLVQFYELQEIRKDMREKTRLFLNAGFQFHVNWRLVTGLEYLEQTQQERQQLNREQNSIFGELQFATTANTRLGVRLNQSSGTFPYDQVNNRESFSNDFREWSLSTVAYWEGSEKSHFEGRIGLTKREQVNSAYRNFQGLTGQIKYIWLVTSKTRIDISTWRETTNREELATYILTQGLSIGPRWSLSEKILINPRLKYEYIDFNNRLDGAKRLDTLSNLFIGVNYTPIRNVELIVSLENEKRNSTIDLAEFNTTLVSALVRLIF